MSKLANAWVNEKTGEIHSPKSRMIYHPNLFEAKTNPKVPNSKPKFNACLLIPKAANIDEIKKEIARAAVEEHGAKWQEKKLRLPLVKTVDEPKLAQFAEEYPFVLKTAANEGFPPFVFGPDAKPFSGGKSEVYSGRWAVIAGGAWGYSTGSIGVGWNLNRIQILDHDEQIGSTRTATAEGFDAVEVAASGNGSTDGLWDPAA